MTADPPRLPGPLNGHPLVSDWLRLRTEGGVEVRSGRVELGQGNLTAIAQIAADELDVPVEGVSVTSGDTEVTPDEGFTAGSMSIAVGGACVRLAASAARHLLLAEAGRLVQRGAERLSIRDGRILADGMETDLTLWGLADTVSLGVPVADHARPKPPEARRVAGRPLPRSDLMDRICGAPFVHDLQFEGMLHGRPIHPPNMRARLESLDLEALRARPGVRDVVRDGSFTGVLADREEDAVAAAAWGAERATWSEVAAGDGSPIEHIAASEAETERIETRGDVASAEGRRVSTVVSRPYLSHGSIGPSCAVARWDGERLRVWTHSQGVFQLRNALADVFGIAPERIHVSHAPGAGCYGHNGADDVALDAALLARAVPGTPVRVVWSRADEFACAPLGPGMVTRAEAVLGEDGRVSAMRVVANSAPHGNRPGRNGSPNLRAAAYLERSFPIPRSTDVPPANGGGADRNAVPLYDIPNVEVSKRLVHDLPYRTSSLRGLGAHLNVFAIETLMDDLAAEAGANPLEFRLRHLSAPRARAVLERTAELAGWPGAEREGIARGMGFARYKNTAAWCCVITECEVADEVRVLRAWAGVDAGEAINPDGIANQIEGGIIQSTSWTLKEQVGFADGAVITRDWESYPILPFAEVPEVEVALIDRPEAPPLGCAEAAQGPTAAAIGNAVARALGVRVRDLPLSRDRIISALM